MKRKFFYISLPGAVLGFSIAFLSGCFIAFISLKGPLDQAAEASASLMQSTTLREAPPSVGGETDLGLNAGEKIFNAWRSERETCQQWLSVQKMSKAYVDAYVVGSQKGATSEIAKRLHKLGVRKPDMMKEWHCFNKMTEKGEMTRDITTHLPFEPQDLKKFRLVHYQTGFPKDASATEDTLPVIDDRPPEERLLVYDSTVEYLHTDRAAFLVHALTPHARIIITMRDPIDRAISQFNMVSRTYNRKKREMGKPDQPVTPERFHEVAEKEIQNLIRCGYDAHASTLKIPTSQLISCMFAEYTVNFEKLLYITRGLYHIHVQTWRNYFPDHRIQYISFNDFTEGKVEAYHALTEFLCIRRFPEELLDEFKTSGSSLSYGQQAAINGLNKAGSGDVFNSDNDKYMVDILPKTRKMLEDFYAPATRRLEAMMGRKMY